MNYNERRESEAFDRGLNAGRLDAAKDLAAARKEAADDIAAWLLDRADQYETDDPIWVGIADLAKGVARGDAQDAARHGELDTDLYLRLGIRPSSVLGPPRADAKE